MSTRSTEPISPQRALQVARQAVRWGKREGARVVVAGGLAMYLFGHTRNTCDVDVLASKPIGQGRYYHKPIAFGGSTYLVPLGGRSRVLDVIIRDDDARPLYASSIAHAVKVRGVLVADPEHLVLMKLQAGRYKDLADVQFFLETKQVTTARVVALARRIGGQFYASEVRRGLHRVRDQMRAERRTEK